MKTRISILCLLIAVSARATQPITDWMATYYLTTDDTRLSLFWEKTVARGSLEKLKPPSEELLIGFLGAVMRTHADFLRSHVKAVAQFPEGQRDGIELILWLSQTEYGKGLLIEAGRSDMAALPCPPVSCRSLLVDEDANFLEGWYWATGDTGSLEPFLKSIVAEGAKAEFAGGALGELISRDSRARDYIVKNLKSGRFSGKARQIIESAIKQNLANQAAEPSRTAGTAPANAGARASVAPGSP